MTHSLRDALRWVDHGTRLLDDAIARQSSADLQKASGLPGWTRAHVVAHVNANADALTNLVTWAATGAVTPMYASPEQRDADIEQGSKLSSTQLLTGFGRSATMLASAMASLDAVQWRQEVKTAQGRTVLAAEIPWLRAREVCVHAVDLDAGIGFSDLPEDFLEALRVEIAAKRSLREMPAGPLGDITAWLAGRPHALDGVPRLGPWL